MKVSNKAQFPVIAFCVHAKYGYGEDVFVGPGECKDVPGPYVGEVDGRRVYFEPGGGLACIEIPDNTEGFQVGKNQPLFLEAEEDWGISVRHNTDKPDPEVLSWRQSATCECL